MISISKNNLCLDIDCSKLSLNSFNEQLNTFDALDQLFIEINKQKYHLSQNMIQYISEMKVPNTVDVAKISLIGLYYYFHSTFSSKNLEVASEVFEKISGKIKYKNIVVISKLNNFPHMIGVRAERDFNGSVISKIKPKLFLDGVLFQWILLNSLHDISLDISKIEVISWVKGTIKNPTYILDESGIKENNTKIDANLVFIKRLARTNKYAFHLVFLKHERDNNFAIMSQFAILKERYERINKMFNLSKSLYNFYEVTR